MSNGPARTRDASDVERSDGPGDEPRTRCRVCSATYASDALFCAKDGTRLEPDDERPPDSDPYIGTVISGDIEILGVAGAGAMGRVYRAHQRGIDRNVAVKILHRELSGNAQQVQRFHREAKIASKLQHPHVVEVYLAGQLEDGALYIVMEYLDGMSLGEALTAAGGSFNPARALSVALQICDAVGEGHARGIVHRDLKPENVMLVRRADLSDWAKVLDFGIAKVAAVEQSMQTAAGLVFGTARYISPEGAQGSNVGPQGDVYSIATIVYQLLAGRTPFDAEPVGMLIKHIHEPPPPLASWPRAAGLPSALTKVVMDNLVKEPGKRAANARAFGAALAQAAKDANITISEVGLIARLGSADPGQRISLDPTIDEGARLSAPQISVMPQVSIMPQVSMPPQVSLPMTVGMAPPQNLTEPLLVTSTSSVVPARAAVSTAPTAPTRKAAETTQKQRPVAVIVLAFLLGATLAVLISQQLSRHADSDRDAHVARTRAALADGRYITPPGDCVRDLVVTGLKRWPNDIDLIQLRSTASMELVTRAMVAQNGGDVSGARDLAHDATTLDPADHSATLLLNQYDDEMKSAAADAGPNASKPHVLFDALPLTHPGKRVDLAAHVVTGNLGPHAKVESVKMTLFDHSATGEGVKIPVVPAGQNLFRATMAAPKAGNYDVVFEATLEGTNVRAVRELTVAR